MSLYTRLHFPNIVIGLHDFWYVILILDWLTLNKENKPLINYLIWLESLILFIFIEFMHHVLVRYFI